MPGGLADIVAECEGVHAAGTATGPWPAFFKPINIAGKEKPACTTAVLCPAWQHS